MKIAETINQYEKELLYDVESHHHEYTLEYDEEKQEYVPTIKKNHTTQKKLNDFKTTLL
mgnify:CR=1 FL=1